VEEVLGTQRVPSGSAPTATAFTGPALRSARTGVPSVIFPSPRGRH
jgi:hypothetical protein